MASVVPPEIDNDSMASSPRSEYDNPPRVRFMCTFGGRILPRPPDNQLCYVGGDNRMVAVQRHTTFASLLSKLAKLSGKTNMSVKYQLPNEDLDALISVSTDEDVENMMEEYERVALNQNPRSSSRLRLFLFTKTISGEEEDDNVSRASSISSLLDNSVNRDQWFLDALNHGSSAASNGGSGKGFERVRSEVSSIVSEVPDYLFGLDHFDETAPPQDRDRRDKIRREVSTVSDPGSPRRDVPSPYGSTSSAPVITSSTMELLPVKTKPECPEPVLTPKADPKPEQVIQQSNLPVNSQWQYANPGPQFHYQSPVYMVQPGNHLVQQGSHMVQQGSHMVQPGSPMVQLANHMVQPGNHMVQPVLMPGQYLPQYQHVPMGYHHQPQPHQIPGPGQVYGETVRPVMMAVNGVNQAAYYGMQTPGPVQVYQHHPSMVVPGVEKQYRTKTDSDPGGAS